LLLHTDKSTLSDRAVIGHDCSNHSQAPAGQALPFADLTGRFVRK